MAKLCPVCQNILISQKDSTGTTYFCCNCGYTEQKSKKDHNKKSHNPNDYDDIDDDIDDDYDYIDDDYDSIDDLSMEAAIKINSGYHELGGCPHAISQPYSPLPEGYRSLTTAYSYTGD